MHKQRNIVSTCLYQNTPFSKVSAVTGRSAKVRGFRLYDIIKVR